MKENASEKAELFPMKNGFPHHAVSVDGNANFGRLAIDPAPTEAPGFR